MSTRHILIPFVAMQLDVPSVFVMSMDYFFNHVGSYPFYTVYSGLGGDPTVRVVRQLPEHIRLMTNVHGQGREFYLSLDGKGFWCNGTYSADYGYVFNALEYLPGGKERERTENGYLVVEGRPSERLCFMVAPSLDASVDDLRRLSNKRWIDDDERYVPRHDLPTPRLVQSFERRSGRRVWIYSFESILYEVMRGPYLAVCMRMPSGRMRIVQILSNGLFR